MSTYLIKTDAKNIKCKKTHDLLAYNLKQAFPIEIGL